MRLDKFSMEKVEFPIVLVRIFISRSILHTLKLLAVINTAVSAWCDFIQTGWVEHRYSDIPFFIEDRYCHVMRCKKKGGAG